MYYIVSMTFFDKYLNYYWVYLLYRLCCISGQIVFKANICFWRSL